MAAKLFKNVSKIVTMNEQDEVLADHDLLVKDGRIARISPEISKTGRKSGDDMEVINSKDFFMYPGLINTHHHFYQVLTRNIRAVQDVELFDWLKFLYPIWSHLDAEAVYFSTLAAAAELLKTGCTTTVDQFYVFPDQSDKKLIDQEFSAAEDIGIRLHACRGSMSLGQDEGGLPPNSVVQSEEEILEDTRRIISEYHDSKPFARRRVIVSPCSPFSVTRELMEKSIELARDEGVLAHTHLAETKDEEEFCRSKFGCSPLEYMKEVGWLGDDVWFAHGVHLNEDELAELAEYNTGVAHCPTSNMKLSSGVAPLPRMLEKGVPVGLAVDGSASNDSSDMIGEMKTGLLLHKLTSGITSVGPEDILRLATRGGSEILKQPRLGSLEEGQAADLFMLNSKRVGLAGGLSDPISALINTGVNNSVDMTVVAGEIVVRQGQVVSLDEKEISERTNEIASRMLAEEGIDYETGH